MLEPRYGIDLRGTTKPTLYFWTRFDLNTSDRLLVEASTDDGYTWDHVLWDNSAVTVSEWVNLGWHRVQVDLTPFIQTQPTDPPLRLRFRLHALNTSAAADGWYIDDFTLYDRALMPQFGQNFADPFTTSAIGWWRATGQLCLTNTPAGNINLPLSCRNRCC